MEIKENKFNTRENKEITLRKTEIKKNNISNIKHEKFKEELEIKLKTLRTGNKSSI